MPPKTFPHGPRRTRRALAALAVATTLSLSANAPAGAHAPYATTTQPTNQPMWRTVMGCGFMLQMGQFGSAGYAQMVHDGAPCVSFSLYVSGLTAAPFVITDSSVTGTSQENVRIQMTQFNSIFLWTHTTVQTTSGNWSRHVDPQ